MKTRSETRFGQSVWGRLLLPVVVCGLVAGGCVRERSAVTGEKQFFGYSWEQERQLGQAADQQMVQQMGLYEDEDLQRYVQAVGQRVLAESDLRRAGAPAMYRDAPFAFRIVDSAVVNAFALPGGYVYVTRGLLNHMQNEAQLAVVLGHEIAHVAARHSSRQAVKAQVGQLGLIAGAIVGQQVTDNPNLAGNILDLGGTAFQLLLTKYSRDAEREADRLGVRYAANEGYRVAEAASFFNTLQRIGAESGSYIPPWQATHPDPGEREETMRELGARLEPPDALAAVGQDRFLAVLEGTVVGDDPRHGFVREGVFYHPGLKFQFPVPPRWQLQNERAAVLMVAPDQGAVMVLEITAAQSARAAADQLTQSQGVSVQSATPVQVNGLEAVRTVAQANTQQGQVALMNHFIEYGGQVYSLMGYTSAAKFNAYTVQFQRSAEGFQTVDDPEILDVQPSRIRVVAVSEAAPFRSFLPEELPAGLTPTDLAIMNQVELEETIPAGRKLKLPN